ncbi:MAG: hypothetical protein K8J31_02605 [Anaerolineae bacterium]|nr:hypothetical protein [Anaerolineae bacterium]
MGVIKDTFQTGLDMYSFLLNVRRDVQDSTRARLRELSRNDNVFCDFFQQGVEAALLVAEGEQKIEYEMLNQAGRAVESIESVDQTYRYTQTAEGMAIRITVRQLDAPPVVPIQLRNNQSAVQKVELRASALKNAAGQVVASDWLALDPGGLAIEPGSAGTVNATMTLPTESLAAGSYRADIYILGDDVRHIPLYLTVLDRQMQSGVYKNPVDASL